MHAELENGGIKIYDAYLYRESIKEINGRVWEPGEKVWVVPYNDENIAVLSMLGCELRGELLKRRTCYHNKASPQDTIIPIEPMPIKLTPYQHQVQGYNRCLQNDGYGLLFDMGLGKTITAMAVASRRYQRGEVKRLLIVCPSAVMPVWEREFEVAAISYSVYMLEGAVTKRKQLLKQYPTNGLQVAVINFEGTWRMETELVQWQPDMLIVDESQRIKNAQSRQSKAVHKIAKAARYRVILSGTPVSNSPLDVYSQWKVIDEEIFGSSYYAFRARYAIMGGYSNKQITGYKNLVELTQKAHSKALRISKEQALDLPEQVDEFRYCELDPQGERIYRSIEKDCYAELQKGEIKATNILTLLLRLQQVSGGFVNAGDEHGAIPQRVSTAKVELLCELLDDLAETDEKLVIFARFTAEVTEIERLLERKGICYETLSGKSKNRGDIVNRFQTDGSIKAMVAQIAVGGVGITLHSASVVIYYSTTFSLTDYLQSRSRTHRIGQQRRCLYIHLVCRNTVDEKILETLAKKQDIATAIVDDWKRFVKP